MIGEVADDRRPAAAAMQSPASAMAGSNWRFNLAEEEEEEKGRKKKEKEKNEKEEKKGRKKKERK